MEATLYNKEGKKDGTLTLPESVFHATGERTATALGALLPGWATDIGRRAAVTFAIDPGTGDREHHTTALHAHQFGKVAVLRLAHATLKYSANQPIRKCAPRHC